MATPVRLAEYRDYLLSTRERNALFDTAGFTTDFESLVSDIYDDHLRDT